MRFPSSSRRRRSRPASRVRTRRKATTDDGTFMLRRFLQFGPLVLLMLTLAAQTASAQNGERLREKQAQRQEARRERAAAANGAKGQPGERAMEGLPPVWVQRLRDMPPEQQQRFLENNEQFNRL